MVCIDREDPSLPYVALKNKLMHCHNKEWGLEDAARLLQRLIEAFDEDCVVVKDYFEKLRLKLLAKKEDPDFTKLQGFFMLSMGLSKPHQMAFDKHMKTLRDTKTNSMLLEPFDKALRSKMQTAQKKHLTGDSKQLPLGDLTKQEYRKCGLIATLKIRPEEPKVKVKTDTNKSTKNKKTKSKENKTGKGKNENRKTKTKTDSNSEIVSKAENVENTAQPAPKKAKKVKVPPEQVQEVLEGLLELKVSNIIICFL